MIKITAPWQTSIRPANLARLRRSPHSHGAAIPNIVALGQDSGLKECPGCIGVPGKPHDECSLVNIRRGERLDFTTDEDSGRRVDAADARNEGSQLGEEEVRALQGMIANIPSLDQLVPFPFRASLCIISAGPSDKYSSLTQVQVVRRKAGKRHNGYLYIICKANPRHKQRQG